MAAASSAALALGGELRLVQPKLIPGLRKDVSVVLADKVAPTSSRYPRRTGVPAHRPLTAK